VRSTENEDERDRQTDRQTDRGTCSPEKREEDITPCDAASYEMIRHNAIWQINMGWEKIIRKNKK
jgi:hypothetical protein